MDTTISLAQAGLAAFTAATIIGAYFLGRTVERMEYEKMQRSAAARQRNIDRTRRAS